MLLILGMGTRGPPAPGTPPLGAPPRSLFASEIDRRAAEAPATGVPTVTCDVERWSVKTLSDVDAARVNFDSVPATVAELRAIPSPVWPPSA